MLYKDFKEYESFGEEDKVDYLFDAVAYCDKNKKVKFVKLFKGGAK